MKTRHFTALKTPAGWEVYNGEPDNRGNRSTYNTMTHSDNVIDYCDSCARACDSVASVHFDCRGAS